MASIAPNTTFIALGFPVEVRLGDDRILSDPSGRAAAMIQPIYGEPRAALLLNLRRFRYGMETAKRLWTWLKAAGRQAGERSLTLDLIFSFVYGGALAASLWWVWEAADQLFHPAWIVAPFAMILTADGMDQPFHMTPRRRHMLSNSCRGQYVWMTIYRCATMMRIWFTLGLYGSLAAIVLKMVFTLSERRFLADAAK